MFKPVKRVATQLGTASPASDGTAPVFNILGPDARLHYNCHHPVAQLRVDPGHGPFNTGWNYYEYREETFAVPANPGYFHASTLSLLYAF